MMKRLDCFDVCQWPQATDEHRQYRDAISRFVEERIDPFAAQWDEAGEMPRSLHREAGEIGLLGLGYPQEYGGLPCDALTRIIATLELCRAGCGGVNASLLSHTIMVGPLIAAADPAVRARVLPRIFSGEAIGALAITEASGGSDVAAIHTRAQRVADGWKLNGSKMFITSGMRADHYLVAARTGAPGSAAAGLSFFLVDRDTPGFSRAPLRKTGWWCSDTAELHFDDCIIPSNHLVGAEHAGFRLAMMNFNQERLMLAIGAIGFAMTCVEEALDWARQRVTFGQPLIEHQVIRQKLTRMIDEILPALSHGVMLGQQMDAGLTPAGAIALAKNHAARVMRRCADEAVQILGGSGFIRGSRSERIYREVKVMMIGGGAEEVLNDLAARQLGLIPLRPES